MREISESASLYPGIMLPLERTIAGVPVIPSFLAILILSSMAVVSHVGSGTGFFENASSRRERDFSHMTDFVFLYASLCIGRGYNITKKAMSSLFSKTFFIS